MHNKIPTFFLLATKLLNLVVVSKGTNTSENASIFSVLFEDGMFVPLIISFITLHNIETLAYCLSSVYFNIILQTTAISVSMLGNLS